MKYLSMLFRNIMRLSKCPLLLHMLDQYGKLNGQDSHIKRVLLMCEIFGDF